MLTENFWLQRPRRSFPTAMLITHETPCITILMFTMNTHTHTHIYTSCISFLPSLLACPYLKNAHHTVFILKSGHRSIIYGHSLLRKWTVKHKLDWMAQQQVGLSSLLRAVLTFGFYYTHTHTHTHTHKLVSGTQLIITRTEWIRTILFYMAILTCNTCSTWDYGLWYYIVLSVNTNEKHSASLVSKPTKFEYIKLSNLTIILPLHKWNSYCSISSFSENSTEIITE